MNGSGSVNNKRTGAIYEQCVGPRVEPQTKSLWVSHVEYDGREKAVS